MMALTLPDECHARCLIDSARGYSIRLANSQQVLELRKNNDNTVRIQHD